MSLSDLIHRAGALVPAPIRRLEIFRRPYERAMITRNFQRVFGRPPDLGNPRTFNEKIAYKMLYDRRPILTRLADRVRAREYVAERIGAEYLPELYQVCRRPAEIDWRRLPRRFAIKATHGTAMNIFVRDKSDVDPDGVCSRLEAWLSRNIYYSFREWAYRDIPPAILIEELLTEGDGAMAVDWKFYTFDGRAEFLQVNLDRFGDPKRNDYDRRLNRMEFTGRYYPNSPADPKLPHNLELMFTLAERLGGGLDFVRVDMYNLDGRIVFGEFTNYPGAGLDPFHPAEFDELYGSKWRVPARYR
jgi:teichuronopeptide biosynthesis TupA-like protein